MKRCLLCTLIVVTLPVTQAQAQYNAQRGSVIGGLAGAAAGAAIGEHNDKPLAGALIGGALGLMSGAAMGNARDRQVADQRAYQYHQQQQFQHQQNREISQSVSPTDVIGMSRRGLGDAVIINHIQANGVRSRLQVADVISLHENGVSEPVISAMQNARIAGTTVVTPAQSPVIYQQPAPIIVEQYVTPRYQHYAAPRVYYPHSHYRHHHGHGVHFFIGR